MLSISSNTALFSILGSAYGGDRTTTFALPDLRARVPVGMGAAPRLDPEAQDENAGNNVTTMTVANLRS